MLNIRYILTLNLASKHKKMEKWPNEQCPRSGHLFRVNYPKLIEHSCLQASAQPFLVLGLLVTALATSH